MPVIIPKPVLADIVTAVLKGKDHRNNVTGLIESVFVNHVADFIHAVARAKLSRRDVNEDWWKKYVIETESDPARMLNYAGTAQKTRSNTAKQRGESVFAFALRSHDELLATIDSVLNNYDGKPASISLQTDEVIVKLAPRESMVFLNAIGLYRNSIRGGVNSAIGKQAEVPLMQVLCGLYGVAKHRPANKADGFGREVDYVIFNDKGDTIKCEVKLMGKGNPESADAPLARGTGLFLTNTLSEKMKRECTRLGVPYVVMQGDWILDFGKMLDKLGVSHTGLDRSIDLADAVKQKLRVM